MEHKKIVSETIQELYLYPYHSKGINIFRCSVWIVSWMFGIEHQLTIEPEALGVAYLIFAASLMPEFVLENKEHFWSRIIHGLFCLHLFGMLIGACILSWVPAAGVLYPLLVKALPWGGRILCLVMAGDVGLMFFDTHKLFYDKEAEKKRKAENNRKLAREQFEENLKGPSERGNE